VRIAVFALLASSCAAQTLSNATITAGTIVAPVVPVTQNVLTAAGSNARLGAQTADTVLTQALVSDSSKFGSQCTYAMPDGGWPYGQPLVATNVGGKNLLIVATMGGSGGGGNHLYAFNEGSCSGTPVWSQSFGAAWTTYTSAPEIFYGFGIGILSTPVIDIANGWVFCVSFSGSTPTIKINKVNLTDGTILAQTTINNSVTVPGVGCIAAATSQSCAGVSETTSGSNLLFNPAWQDQRDALLLVGGNVYAGFSSLDENDFIWHGWFLCYDEATLTLQHTYTTTSGNGVATGANGGGAAWSPGSGASSDGTYIYLPVGNGTSDISTGGPDASMSLLKLNTSLAVVDYWQSANWSANNTADADVDCSPMLLDGSHVACANKDGCGWLISTASLGHVNAMATTPPTGCSAGSGTANQVWQIQSVTPGAATGVFGGAFGDGKLFFPVNGGSVYAYSYSGGIVNTTPTASSLGTYALANLAYSSNGGANPILWAATCGASAHSTAQAVVVVAFNPSTMGVLNSWGGIGNISKWAKPTIDGAGHVLVATDQGVVQFGPL
jgi:hypothetical protein